ncbi:DUF58 domain-containing protein [Pseudohongiella sp. SYSU M77423]|uniref:DUF58 domain-containing protein n=1 Tax=unclassified Pseudohongiella TaxID=2629611 RepID=UPI000C6695BD|nr:MULTISPECIES: DUF58 domain-containing protein [unclassified Pseudohongiella]MAO38765.1 DUF58 domain-containing protein [Pseudohongiella sp.]MAY56156.1 DUF58 domain-containing protein [Gammaproteobacteria bacterium]MEC8858471.1 DUF58 domain-containing protein [Pseudomonadota bacterium]MBJ54535.1 DUF58 domain-containing protein [Gammaproteobacteria bacterium]MDH7945018.1 DUF58 domain-containing protein [Pseudohongiella sp. SYSU M77423]|tara:strand:- start:2443 stop:3417 length:975 start_codon:yes stop_codon:yes gene_type:complete
MSPTASTLPHQELYQAHGAVITLQDLLLQRYAARTIEYASHKRSVAGISGLHMSKMRGRGIDFEEFRPYQPGDDIRTIDWRVTARIGKPFTKVYREERERPVLVAIDQSSTMFFGSKTAFKSVVAAQAAAIFCWMAIDNGDRVGGLVYGDDDFSLVRPKRSRRSALHLLNQVHLFNMELAASATRRAANTDPEAGSLATTLGRIRRITKPGSTLYIISDFTSIDDAGFQYLSQISRHNNVVCCFVYDPLEENLPVPGYYSITDGQDKGTLNTFNKKARESYRSVFQQRLDFLQGEMNKLQIPLLTFRTDEPVVERIHQWTSQKL